MLDHLYDALEEVDQRAFLDHLSGCPACQADLEKARAQQRLLARAARLHFPDVSFAPPKDELASQPQTVLLPVRPRSKRSRTWVRWAIAACLLLALGGLSVPAYRARQDYLNAADTVRAHDDTITEAREAVASASYELREAIRHREDEIEKIHHDIKARELRLVVSGPSIVQAGANSEFQVRALDLNGKPADAEIFARLTRDGRAVPRDEEQAARPMAMAFPVGPGRTEDRKGTTEKDDQNLSVAPVAPGVYRVRIPPTVRLQAGQSLGMLVDARKKGGTGNQVSLTGKVQLSSSVYLTHLTTDKPMYQPGEIVHFRSLTLDRFTHQPANSDLLLHFTLTTPLGEIRPIARGVSNLVRLAGKTAEAVTVDGKPLRGVGAGELSLDSDLPGGEYTLTVSEEQGKFPPVTRKFLVNRYQKPRLDKKLEFNRSSYGPGDEVQARFTARRADGGAVAERSGDFRVNIDERIYGPDGKESAPFLPLSTDHDGTALIRFKLPTSIERGLGSLSVKIDDGGVVETIVRSIPIVLKKVNVEFFPEGGDLVANLPNRIYFQARTPLGKPAQIKGTLLENGVPLPVAVETLSDDDRPGVNQGNGVFSFTPRAGRQYELRIDSPTGITERKPLPAVREDGVVLSIPGGVFEPTQPIRVQLHSTSRRPLMIGAYCRGQLLDMVEVAEGTGVAILRPTVGAGGVCRITVFEELATGQEQRHLKPVAERLVYRHPQERLDVSISADRRSYIPGQKARVTIATTSEKETLTPALAMVSIVDKSVLELADEKTARTMPTHFLLTNEVRRSEDLEYADFLLGSHPKATLALDLLLGTQGWRRFAEQDPNQFRDRLRKKMERLSDPERLREQAEGERLLVMIGQSSPRTTDFDKEKLERVLGEFERKAAEAQSNRVEATQKLSMAAADHTYKAAVVKLGRYQNTMKQIGEIAFPILVALAVLLGLAALILALANKSTRALACAGLTAACVLLLVFNTRMPTTPLASSTHLGEQGDTGTIWSDDKALAKGKPSKLEEELATTGAKVQTASSVQPGEGAGGFAFAPPGPTSPAMAHLQSLTRPAAPPERTHPPEGSAATARGATSPATVPAPTVAKGRKAGDSSSSETTASIKTTRTPNDTSRIARGDERGKLLVEPSGKSKELDRRLASREFDAKKRIDDGFSGRGFGAERFTRERGDKDKDGYYRFESPLVFREYAHTRAPVSDPTMRSDFTETLLWHPVLLLPDGNGTVSFDLCDSVTSFQVTVFAHTLDGRLGAGTRAIESRLPLTVAPKLPIEVTASDRIDVPIAINNHTSVNRTVELKLLTAEGLDVVAGKKEDRFNLPAEGRTRRLMSLQSSLNQGQASLALEGRTEALIDAIRETIRVVSDGFPVTGSSSDILEKSATHRITLPRWIPGTLDVRVDVYPSTLSDLQKGLEGLLREPNGCFEQTSTSNYPNVLILDYLKSNDLAAPDLEKRARELLDRGYKRLTSFECQEPAANTRRGYEWFGGSAPPHEALTAYGLLQFRDMARFHPVDAAMLERTRTYLASQRDGVGGFKRNARAVGAFGRAPEHVTNAYIIWALTESGTDDVKTELDALAKQASTSDDPYFLALVALSLTNRGRKSEGAELLRKVVAKQQADGHLDAAKTSITSSGGRDLAIETTALAILGWLKNDPLVFDAPIRKAIRWIGQQRGGSGTFGSTQATILALKAAIAWSKTNQRLAEPGELRLYVDDEKVAQVSFSAAADRTLTLTVPSVEKRLRPGMNRLRVEITGAMNVFPHTLSWTCRTTTPESGKVQNVKLETKLAQLTMEEGDSIRLKVKVENVSGQEQGMAVAIIGLPAGLIVPEDLKQLKEHCKIPDDGKRPLVGAFEIRGRELILYWRDLAKGETIEVPIDLVARVPGKYRGPASRAYLYYNADHKHWIEPLEVTIKAK
jgi:hypothetical protein